MAAPATVLVGCTPKANLLAAAGLTVSCCVTVGVASAASVAVMVGVPTFVSVYAKLAVLLLPAAIVSDGLKKLAPLEVLVRLIVCAVPPAVATLPYWSFRVTVIVADATPAVSVWAAGLSANWLAAAALTVSCCEKL